MLSKKKDSGINDGIAGKYVKRETPPMLRNYHTPVRQTPNFQRRSVKTPATFYVPQQTASNVISSRTQVTTRTNVQSSIASQETRAQQLSPPTQQRNTQSAPPQISQLSQGLQNLSVADRSDDSGSTSSLKTQGSSTNQGSTTNPGTSASSGQGIGPQLSASESLTQQSSGQRNNLGAIREDFHDHGNQGSAQNNYSDYHNQYDENYQIQQYHEEIRNHYAQQSGGHVTSTQHSLQSSTQQSSTSTCKYSNECADKKCLYPSSVFQPSLNFQQVLEQMPYNNDIPQHNQLLSTTVLGNQPNVISNNSSNQNLFSNLSNLNTVQCNQNFNGTNTVQHSQSTSNLSNLSSISTSTLQDNQSTSNLSSIESNLSSISTSTRHDSQSTSRNSSQHYSSHMQHCHSSSSVQSSNSTSSDTAFVVPQIDWQYSSLQNACPSTLQSSGTMRSSVSSTSSLCSSSSIITDDKITNSFV